MSRCGGSTPCWTTRRWSPSWSSARHSGGPRADGVGVPGRRRMWRCACWCSKRVKGWSFEETEREVRGSLGYRWVTRIHLGRVPDDQTLLRLSHVVGEEGVRALHARVVELAIAAMRVQGRRARLGTTVIETNIHCPTDSTLLADGIRAVTRAMRRIAAATGIPGRRVRNRLRATCRRVWEIVRASRRQRRGRPSLIEGYRRLIALARAIVREARRVVHGVRQARQDPGSGARLGHRLRGLCPLPGGQDPSASGDRAPHRGVRASAPAGGRRCGLLVGANRHAAEQVGVKRFCIPTTGFPAAPAPTVVPPRPAMADRL